MTRDLAATPPNIDFGNVKIGKSKTVDVVLSASGNLPPTVTAANIEGNADFSGGEANETDYPAMLMLGKIWTKYNTDLEPRRGFGCVKMNGYIYVVGGKKNDQYPEIIYNDCKRSRDGVTWETMSSSCFDHGRSDLALFTLNDKLYAVGGLVNGVATDEVWVSENMGFQWVLCGNTEEPVAKMAYCQTETTLYYFGGINEVGALVNIIAKSSDGIDWASVYTATGVSARSCACMISAEKLNGSGYNIHIACGYDGTDMLDDFWVASDNDLESWTEKTKPFGSGNKREGVAGISFGTHIFFHGGNTLDPDEVYSSSDIKYSGNGGETWTDFGDTKTRRSYHNGVIINSSTIAIIGGIGGDTP